MRPQPQSPDNQGAFRKVDPSKPELVVLDETRRIILATSIGTQAAMEMGSLEVNSGHVSFESTIIDEQRHNFNRFEFPFEMYEKPGQRANRAVYSYRPFVNFLTLGRETEDMRAPRLGELVSPEYPMLRGYQRRTVLAQTIPGATPNAPRVEPRMWSIVLNDGQISRTHTKVAIFPGTQGDKLRCDEFLVEIKDAQSTNGTFFNVVAR